MIKIYRQKFTDEIERYIIKNIYDMTLQDISEKVNIPVDRIEKYLKRNNWMTENGKLKLCNLYKKNKPNEKHVNDSELRQKCFTCCKTTFCKTYLKLRNIQWRKGVYSIKRENVSVERQSLLKRKAGAYNKMMLKIEHCFLNGLHYDFNRNQGH